MEAIILAGGRAERLGDAAAGKPKALVEIAGRPLVRFQMARLQQAEVTRIIISCADGQRAAFERVPVPGLDVELIVAEEPEPLGRGGGLRFAATHRDGDGPMFALNGDELWDIDLAAMLAQHHEANAAATVAVAPLVSGFGVVDVDDDNRVTGFREAPRLPFWVNCGMYVLGGEAIERLPERGDHERSTFPELAREGKLQAFKHEGVWLTVNTPKELRVARDYVEANPGWLD